MSGVSVKYVTLIISTAITCAEPPDIQNGVKIPGIGPYYCGKHVTYVCNHGYSLEGDHSMMCQENRTFSSRQAVCVQNGMFKYTLEWM